MTTAADPTNYPSQRKRGASGEPDAAPLNYQAPRTRFFSFYILWAATCRRSWSTPMIQGPAIIKGIELDFNASQDPPYASVEIGESAIAVTENNVPLTDVRPFSVLTELLDPFGNVDGRAGDGLLNTTGWTGHVHYERPLDIILGPGQHYVVLSVSNGSAQASSLNGSLRVIEGVDPDALRFFL